ncbi:hypothetical protein [Sphingopyxis macrogoltabida]|uniref:Uncharacterized protein n=1 Tax=Sphingopyxis macrogoltabida TaxID=33050 RepID=A0AAC8Z1Y0_SPHMC|nr:hypothetical protein [Sphingopyxis macrogoltabida]ALJ14132.1 hypothetical protein LH19_14760 [Sphingopyxis macrogoltabida]AMU90398.1 hypothetical protein ATM17_15335 [Sphingopyxis macrogoltabida]
MDILTLAGLVKVELPDATLRLCDGAFVKWDAETFESQDEKFGTIGSLETPSQGTGDDIPAMRATWLPTSSAAAADLSQATYQGCRVRMWIAEVDPDTAAVTGTPSLEFDGQVDSTDLLIDRGQRDLEMTISSRAARLMIINEGNNLSPRWHKTLFPGETGEDNAIGVSVGVAWGTGQPAQTSGISSGGSGGGGRQWAAQF